MQLIAIWLVQLTYCLTTNKWIWHRPEPGLIACVWVGAIGQLVQGFLAMYGRNSSLESRWMGDATIPEVSTFVFMPNGPARCKKKEAVTTNLLSLFNTFFKAFEMITIYIFRL